ncbi:MAG: 2OG-Fe(II) oxygenase [Myxococcota bacterium]
MTPPSAKEIATRVASIDWEGAHRELDDRGFATMGPLFGPEECAAVARTYEDALFRKHIVMAKHGYGAGDYKYYSYPLPPFVQALRETIYPHLVDCANRWEADLGRPRRYPPTLSAFTAECHAANQARPTPLILRYEAGGYNRLHQDLYGDIHFPLQLAILLSRPRRDFTGGEFVLTEQRSRMQARPQVVPLDQGEAVAFAVHDRPIEGTRGPVRSRMRHGVSTVESGTRTTLGIIFHDAA